MQQDSVSSEGIELNAQFQKALDLMSDLQRSIFITGKAGTGKSTLLDYFCKHSKNKPVILAPTGVAALNVKGQTIHNYRANRLFEALTIAHGDGSYGRFIQALAKTKLLIIDDWGLEQLSPSQRTDLLEIMEDRHNVSSTLVTSQVPTIHWHECIGDPTLADAILDRLIHNAHKFSLKGESMRKNKNNLTGIDQ